MMLNEVEGIIGRTISPDEWNSLKMVFAPEEEIYDVI